MDFKEHTIIQFLLNEYIFKKVNHNQIHYKLERDEMKNGGDVKCFYTKNGACHKYNNEINGF